MIGESQILIVRIRLLKKLLNWAGFKIICGHWIFTPPLKSSSHVIDLGANKADFSREILTKYGAKCYAVEPNIDLFSDIEDSNIEKFNYAISKENSVMQFFISNNHEASSAIENFGTNWGNRKNVNVQGITWETLVCKLNLEGKKISVVKVDIEGSELDLIESFNAVNISSVEQISVEFHDWLDLTLHERTIEVIKKLISLEFMVISNSPNHSWPVEILFLNKKYIRFSFFQRIIMSVYFKLKFSKY